MADPATTDGAFASPGGLGAADVAVKAVALDVAASALPGGVHFLREAAAIGAIWGTQAMTEGPEATLAGPAAVGVWAGSPAVFEPV